MLWYTMTWLPCIVKFLIKLSNLLLFSFLFIFFILFYSFLFFCSFFPGTAGSRASIDTLHVHTLVSQKRPGEALYNYIEPFYAEHIRELVVEKTDRRLDRGTAGCFAYWRWCEALSEVGRKPQTRWLQDATGKNFSFHWDLVPFFSLLILISQIPLGNTDG